MADVQLPALFGDNMVLQREQPLAFWGTASPRERVSVSLGENSAWTIARADGSWSLKLPAMPAKGSVEVVVKGQNEIVLRNVALGDVWLCAGQSNMRYGLGSVRDADQEVAQANFSNIRLFNVGQQTAETPQREVAGQWQVCTPEAARAFSAVAYYFGRELNTSLRVPIGLVHASWNGTAGESWLSRSAIAGEPRLHPILTDWARTLEKYPAAKQLYDERFAVWQGKVQEASTQGLPEPTGKPWEPPGPDSPLAPSSLWNGMIAPLTRFPLRGVAWYQGESNTSRAAQYRTLFPTLIRDWRRAWKREAKGRELPWVWVQLPNYKTSKGTPFESEWAELREAQLRALSLPQTAMAVAIDIGTATNLHPPVKKEVGYRLGQAALGGIYRLPVAYSGPLPRALKHEGDKIRLHFKNTDGGLTTLPTHPLDVQVVTPETFEVQAVAAGEVVEVVPPLQGFALSGDDRQWTWAEGRIEGDSVLLWSDKVARPVAVRYGWADNPAANLYNGAGLPASPFRTDRWPGLTGPSEDEPPKTKPIKRIPTIRSTRRATSPKTPDAWQRTPSQFPTDPDAWTN